MIPIMARATQRERPDSTPYGAAPLAEVTRALFGEPLTMSELNDRMFGTRVELEPRDQPHLAATWLGSIGYERYREVDDFVRQLANAGVERLIDVRELPISRRRGYAKTALREALEGVGIEYVHMRELGNPKPYRDLYKSGQTQAGRAKYSRLLLAKRRDALIELQQKVTEKRSALMCVEHDQGVCHRDVIIESLQEELGVDLLVAALADS